MYGVVCEQPSNGDQDCRLQASAGHSPLPVLRLNAMRFFSRHFVRWGRQHKRPLQAFFSLAPPVAAVLAAAAACLLVREAWVALRFWLWVSDAAVRGTCV
jgi:hypothetical protein